MKKIALLVLAFTLLFALPASAANYYVNGFVDTNGEACDPNDSCSTHIDYILVSYIITGECITDNVGNTNTHDWVLTKVECYGTGIYTDLQGHSDIDILPLVPFDVKRSALSAAAVDNLGDIISEYGITGNCSSSSFDSYADVILCIAQQILPAWTISSWSYF